MNESHPIIAGIDFTPASVSVLHHALHAAASSLAPVIALHVLDGSRLQKDISGVPNQLGIEEAKKNAGAKLQSWLDEHSPETAPKIEIRVGQPAKEIQNSVRENQANLLVIAANDATKSRLGTVASRCVRSAPCDVMVLRRKQSGNFKKIITCTDFSKTAAVALSRAISIAQKEDAELDIVHVMYPPSCDVWGEVIEHRQGSAHTYDEECRSKANSQINKFVASHADTLAKINHRCTILESVYPAVAITNHILDTETELVVMGTHGHSPLMAHFLGTNAERLMHDSPVSVLAVRSPQEPLK